MQLEFDLSIYSESRALACAVAAPAREPESGPTLSLPGVFIPVRPGLPAGAGHRDRDRDEKLMTGQDESGILRCKATAAAVLFRVCGVKRSLPRPYLRLSRSRLY